MGVRCILLFNKSEGLTALIKALAYLSEFPLEHDDRVLDYIFP